jgi:hypothetical protein
VPAADIAAPNNGLLYGVGGYAVGHKFKISILYFAALPAF